MSVRVTHTLAGLDADFRKMPKIAARESAKLIRNNAKLGNKRAKAFAKVSAGKHGKHYHRAFTAEALGPYSWEYGPDASKPQGDMSFEFGSRQQPPHLDLAKSADIVQFQMKVDVRDLVAKVFWP